VGERAESLPATNASVIIFTLGFFGVGCHGDSDDCEDAIDCHHMDIDEMDMK
jgi:hypothetical protein